MSTRKVATVTHITSMHNEDQNIIEPLQEGRVPASADPAEAAAPAPESAPEAEPAA